MVERDSKDRPFDAIAETVNDQTAEALTLLSNETRLEIIVALWDAVERTPSIAEEDESGLSFSALYDRVGVDDSGQFNYHLDKLTGTFVDHEDGTYTLTRAAWRILSAVIAGAVTDPPSFTDEPVDPDCPLCGGSVVIDYEDELLSVRCTNCEGNFRGPDDPPGVLMTNSLDAAGLTDRTPQEFFRHGNVSQRHAVLSYFEGGCPNCMGTVTVTPGICETHDPGDDSVCSQCGQRTKVWWYCVCEVCKSKVGAPGRTPMYTETAALSFCYERGVDIIRASDAFAWKQLHDASDVSVSARDPLEVTVAVEVAGDQLTVTLDDDAQVIGIEKTTS